MKHILLSALIAVVIAACASSLPYSSNFPLTESTLRSRDGVFTGRIPVGWFSSTEDSLGSSLTAWLTKEDYSATLAVKELKLDFLAARRVQKEGLELLAYLNALMEGTMQPTGEIKQFQFAGRKYASYELSQGTNSSRVVVFIAKGRFYACTARTVKGSISLEETLNLFRAQQTFVTSLDY